MRQSTKSHQSATKMEPPMPLSDTDSACSPKQSRPVRRFSQSRTDGFARDLRTLSLAVAEPFRQDESTEVRYMNVAQAARYMGTTENSIRWMIHCKRLPVIRQHRRVRLDRRDIDAFMNQHKWQQATD